MLTKGLRSDNIYKLSAREKLRERKRSRKAERKKIEKNLKKLSKKVLTNRKEYDILFKLSSREGSDWTLKIKQRDKKRNPRFDDTRYHQEEFLKVLFKQ